MSGACRRMASCNSQRLSSGNRGGSHDQPVSVDSLRRGLCKIPPVPWAHCGIKPKEPGANNFRTPCRLWSTFLLQCYREYCAQHVHTWWLKVGTWHNFQLKQKVFRTEVRGGKLLSRKGVPKILQDGRRRWVSLSSNSTGVVKTMIGGQLGTGSEPQVRGPRDATAYTPFIKIYVTFGITSV